MNGIATAGAVRYACARRRGRCVVGWLALVLALGVRAAPVELHGALDAFAAPGVVLAWAILRGSDEASTEVVVRLDVDAQRYHFVSVVGIDPFTRAAQPLLPPTPVTGPLTVRIPRSRFAELPRTEWRLLTAAGDAPALVIDYGGVPDTTPEFTDPARLAASLDERIARARRERGP
jgi:hypothetical protein